jgi:heat shock protein HslJ
MENSKKVILVSLGLSLGLLILAACASATLQPGAQVTQASGGDLTGSVWSLAQLNGQQLVPTTSITIIFTSGGKLSGSSGCNRYSGAYTSSGNSFQTTSPLASTMMACPQPIMDQEAAYLNSLAAARTYSVSGSQLILSDSSGKNALVYQAQEQVLSGTTWQVIAYNNGKQAVTSVLNGSSITLEFGTDGSLSGNSGCNSYSGTYKATGNQITVGPLISTKMACNSPSGVMDQEAQYLVALQSASNYQIEGTGLELRTANAALAVQAITAPAANTIQGVIWQWVNVTNQSTGKVTTVLNPENYTITFFDNGTLQGKADCNNFTGTYTQESGFSIKLGATTQAYCGGASLDQQYLTLLGSIAAGGPDGAGGLALETAGGEQRMLFKNGGLASK